MDRWLRARNRFGLGARRGESDGRTVAEPRDWLRAQLEPDLALLPAGAGLRGLEAIGSVLGARRKARRGRDEEELQAARRRLRELVEEERLAALRRRVTTDAPFVERLVAFWSNHLCVSTAGDPAVAALAGHYERTVVRPHVLGRFEDMLLASVRHPAMLLYLDNARSTGPGSRVGRASPRRGRGTARGLNENHARELLELHTLGVDGGYDQRDVEETARILTGWTVDPGVAGSAGARVRRAETGRFGFVFRPELHEPGSRTVLGTSYAPGGSTQGEALVRDLARHPAAATHLATKLVRHFVADEPPPAAVERVAGAYRTTEGDLLEVARTLVDLEDAWDPRHRKLRSPQDWVVAGLRALRAPAVPPTLLRVLRELRHPLWGPAAPAGFDDRTDAWADPDALMHRAEAARSLARGAAAAARRRGPPAGGAGLDPRLLLEVVEPDDGGALATMLRDASAPVDERLALALGGPAFQWR